MDLIGPLWRQGDWNSYWNIAMRFSSLSGREGDGEDTGTNSERFAVFLGVDGIADESEGGPKVEEVGLKR